jgi:hypothetical protein
MFKLEIQLVFIIKYHCHKNSGNEDMSLKKKLVLNITKIWKYKYPILFCYNFSGVLLEDKCYYVYSCWYTHTSYFVLQNGNNLWSFSPMYWFIKPSETTVNPQFNMVATYICGYVS